MSVSSERKRELKGLLKKMRINFRSFDLLNISLSHKSFLNETQNSDKNNEKLEFLGDSVLGMVISEYLYKTYKNLSEGDLARIKSHVVSEDSLSKIAREIDLSRYILIGKGEEQTGGRYKKTI
ncbi:MAG TPA: ribonuclease III domain-containing protein, partial [Spirochaetota bacterium]|nr:ribonuclease III domain-containing protein [Spirochaetota bacterium]